MIRGNFSWRRQYWQFAIVTVVVTTLISLGFWQLDRLNWKQHLLGRIKARIAAPRISLPREDIVLQELEFRGVSFAGKFVEGRDVRLFAMDERGAPGYHLYSHFRLEDGRGLIVNRGWLPKQEADKESADFRPRQPLGTLTGRVRLSQTKTLFTPANDIEANIWYFADLDAIATYLSVLDAVPFFVELDDDGAGLWPRGSVMRLNFPNNHLQYAITWFALAGVAALIFGLRQFRGRKVKD